MASSHQSFIGTVEVAKGKAYIRLPFEPDEVWGVKARHHIAGLVGATRIRGPLGAVDGSAALLLVPTWLRDSGVKAGHQVAVELWPEGPQLDALPEDIAEALAASPAAQRFFESLPTFHRKAYLTWLAGAARRPAVRAERLEKFIALLEAGKKERPK